jgi:hypothetical protein
MFRARLDSNGVYFGVEEVEELTADDVEVPEKCDLKIGAYKWVKENKQFVPLPKGKQTKTPDAPMEERALYELIKSLPNPPEYCIKWSNWYKTSLDGGI